MTKQTRTIIFGFLAIAFLVIVPYILLYSLGYRVDISKFKVLATGGIYIKALPQPVTITIDTNKPQTTGVLSPTVFMQNLLPTDHTITITKDGYFDYKKTLAVQEKEVTKIEHVSLIKKQIAFQTVATLPGGVSQIIWSQDFTKGIIQTGTTYSLLNTAVQPAVITPLPLLTGAKNVSFNSQNLNQIFYLKNNNLYNTALTLPVAKNVVAYQIKNIALTYLTSDGFIYTMELGAKTATKLNLVPLTINSQDSYSIIPGLQMLALQHNNAMLVFNKTSGAFLNFYSPISNVLVSPDGQKILYYNDHEIFYSANDALDGQKVFVNRFSQTLANANWLGNDYIIFGLGKDVVISEIDIRGNINMVTLPNTLTISGNPFPMDNSHLYLNQPEKKLYLITQNTLVASERLVP